MAYQYDPAGNRTRTTWPEATPFYITASYDALNRPTALLENGTVSLASYAYDDLSRRTTVTLGNGTTTGFCQCICSRQRNLRQILLLFQWNHLPQ
ncbi:MAG: hypothetical protein U1E01_00465 [Methylicorpusculum sp.]|nr:hypothetical protein [Methylicorpusculum sp.]MDZ4149545.1 hypothetical protein [Methylicorpusculum sp.]